MTKQRIIGLTGGIATGKTSVSNYLATTYNLPILDADIYARAAVTVGSPILKQIVERYGANILLPDGTLNRQQLGNIIFSNLEERSWLEQQIHPEVRAKIIHERLKIKDEKIIVIVIPLLFESGMTDLVTEIWVVCCSEQQQIERLMGRDSLTFGQAKQRINSQMPIQEKCDRADVVLDNSSTLEILLQQVDLALNGLISCPVD
jgi:dephospho-CoA kinase